MPPFLNEAVGYLTQFGFAAIILVGGWILALIIRAAVRGALQRTAIDNRIAERMGAKQDFNIENIVAQVVYYIVMLIVLVAVFQALQLTAVTGPLNTLLNKVFAAIPNLVWAGVLAFIAWVIATLLRFLVTKALGATQFEDKLAQQAGIEQENAVPLSESLGTIIYWFVWLLFIPAILDALQMQGILTPIQGMVDDLLGFLPNVFGAGLILVVGWFIARIIRQIVTSLLIAVGADGFGERLGLSAALGQQSLSGVLGTVVYVLILIPVIISALEALAIEAISAPATNMLNTLLEAVPAIFGAMVVLGAAYILGRLISGLVTTLLTSVGFNKVLGLIGLGSSEHQEGQRTPSEVVGYLVLVGIMLFATIEAAEMLGFGILATLASEFLVFAGQVLLAVIVFGIGLYLANLAHSVILSTAGSNAGLLAQVARIAIIVFTTFMALRQTNIAEDIVADAFRWTLLGLALAVALAFGLGSREIAGREVEKLVNSLRSGDNE